MIQRTHEITIQQSVPAFRVTVILLHTPNPHESLGGQLFLITMHPKLAEGQTEKQTEQ